jgi:hypothetical protein
VPAPPERSAPTRQRTFDFPGESPAAASASPSASTPTQVLSLSKESVRQVIHDRLPEIRACYEKEFKKKPNLRGTVIARFMIAESGAVGTVDMSSSKLPSPQAVECIGQVFSSMQFPPPSNGMLLITYPIDLQPEVTKQ